MNMEQLHAYDCNQNVTEPQATENHIKYTHVYTGTVSQTWLQTGPAQDAGHGDGMDR